MYIKNGFFVKNQWFYILPIGLFLLININAFFQPEVDFNVLIAQMGELPFFAMNVGLFLLFFWGLFFLVRFIHQQPIVKFTTGREKIDFGRIFFSFSLWGLFIVAQTALSYLFFPEDYQWNFQPAPFFITDFFSVYSLSGRLWRILFQRVFSTRYGYFGKKSLDSLST